MSNHKRGQPRSRIRCSLCTDGRRNIGGERQQRERDARAPDAPRVSNGQHWDWCPACNGKGSIEGETCPLCGGAKTIDFIHPRSE